ncbi:hypothetical protein [Methylobrevis albus]|uniref:Lipoprotein n=1 Tax=Methylobrevis albus TaxID=2793297 RepID=A0A931MYP5_9HYPH|nr:hypothetical protein [Methylobrevis albus]MBH0237219.1 hypothetical protein [Methylobrevis albus]
MRAGATHRPFRADTRRILVGLALAAGIAGCVSGGSGENRTSAALLEDFMFINPAMDCPAPVRINHEKHQAILDIVKRDESLAAGAMQASAVGGARAADQMIGSRGLAAYCAEVVKRYGPAGTLYPGLIDVS